MITLPLLSLLQNCSHKERQDLVKKIESKTIKANDLVRITAMMKQYGSLQYTATRSQEYIDAALVKLDSFPESPAKQALAVVADYMVNRDR